MVIKPAGAGNPVPPLRGTEQAGEVSPRAPETKEPTRRPGLPGVEGTFRKADLSHSEKRETIIRAAISEMVQDKLSALGAGSMPEAAKKQIETFMQSDPTVRNLVERYLESVLK